MFKKKKLELKPCPFCGGKAELRKGEISDILQISCTECKAQTEKTAFNYPLPDGKVVTEDTAISCLVWIWNRRVSEE